MPVGQAVTATIDLRRGGGACAARQRAGRRARARRPLRRAAGRRVDHAVDEGDHVLGRSRRRAATATNSGRTSARARLESSFMCSAPPVRRGDQEDEVGRAVRGAEVDRRMQPGEAERGGCRRAASGSAGSRCRRAGRWPTGPRGPWRRRAARPGRWRGRRRRARSARRPMTASLSAPASTSSSDEIGGRDGWSGSVMRDTFVGIGWVVAVVAEIGAEHRGVHATRHRGRVGRATGGPSPGAPRRRCRRRRPSAAGPAASAPATSARR